MAIPLIYLAGAGLALVLANRNKRPVTLPPREAVTPNLPNDDVRGAPIFAGTATGPIFTGTSTIADIDRPRVLAPAAAPSVSTRTIPFFATAAHATPSNPFDYFRIGAEIRTPAPGVSMPPTPKAGGLITDRRPGIF